MSNLLWQPNEKRVVNSQLSHFTAYVNQTHGTYLPDYSKLHEWSVTYPELFWMDVWNFCRIFASVPPPPKKVLQKSEQMIGTKWFLGAEFNFAQNLLRFKNDKPALFFISERGDFETVTFSQLFQKVAILADFFKESGLEKGDRIVGMLPNLPITIIAMLAAASIGAIWSACSSDFGAEGLISRFSQIEPKILIAVDGHFYHGKNFNHLEKIQELQKNLPTLTTTILVPFLDKNTNPTGLKNTILLDDIFKNNREISTLDFAQLPFDHPLYILYSSGTTGKPKCMVHSSGGTLIQHLKELVLHTDLREDDRIFFYTTCTWMMWHWLISSLAVGATVVLYEGSPIYPNHEQLFDLIDLVKINIFGIGAKLIESAENLQLQPRKTHDLSSLKTILTTGSPLLPESFDYVYREIKADVQLSSMSGGSDIISCFALGNPNLPVYRGELQCKGLGMDIKIFNELGEQIINEKGELVCATPFPSMPVFFWNDPEVEKYHHAYFNRFPGIWTHGDYALETENGGIIIYGRSDATLNPSGVRIGTAEIYQQLEGFESIHDYLAVGKQTQHGEIIILFVIMAPNTELTQEFIQKIKDRIRKNTSPLHVPSQIIQAPDLPRTANNKVMEIAVKKLINGETLDNIEAIANPECLNFFKNYSN